MNKQVDIVLFNPPFYRFMGSHNDKIPLSLTYLSRHLEESHISHVVYNADYTGSSSYWSLKWMAEHYDSYVDGVDNRGSLYGETIEHIMSFNPRMVVIMGGEPLVATAEWGNAYIAANFARRLRKQNIYTIGMGPFFTLDPEKFKTDFDCIIQGEPSRKIIEAYLNKPEGIIPFQHIDLNTRPNLSNLFPEKQKTNWAITAAGCSSGCDFCLNAKLFDASQKPVRYIDAVAAADDIAQRKEDDIYLADLNFAAASRERLNTLIQEFAKQSINKTFTIDARVDAIDKEKTSLLKELNVKTVKLGIESLNQNTLDSWGKRITIKQTESAIELLKNAGIGVIFYLIIGQTTTEDDFRATEKFIEKWQPEYIVPNVHAYDLDSDYRYDTEFSPLRLKKLGIDKELFYRYLDLQHQTNPTVGKIIQEQ